MVRQAKTGAGGRPKEVPKPSPVLSIGQIAALKRYSDKDYANSILHDVVRSVAPIIHEYKFKVGTLCEMFPKDANLLGLNVNRGQKILIRLRYHHNDRQFIPLPEVIGTFLHELTHNIHGAHDDKFYEFLNKLRSRFDDIQYNPTSRVSSDGYRCEEQKLGGNSLNTGYVSIRDKRLKALTPLFKGESRKLGGSTTMTTGLNIDSIRDLRLQAIQRRIKDSKWCLQGLNENLQPQDAELDIVEINPVTMENKENITQDENKINQNKRRKLSDRTRKSVDPQLQQVIDLTNEEYGDPKQEIIVIDACKSSLSKKKKSRLDSKSNRKVQFVGLLPSFDEQEKPKIQPNDNIDEPDCIHYSLSSSPSHFIEGEGIRHKYVAQLNFQQILAKANTSTEPKKNLKKSMTTKKKPKKKPRIPKKKIEKSNSEPVKIKKTVKSILFKQLL